MSRYYTMGVSVTGVNPKKFADIKEACKEEWDYEDSDFYEGPDFIEASSSSNLGGGESEEEFTDRLAKAVWKANAGFCVVEVRATYLEDLPCETHVRNKQQYRRLMKGKQK